MSSAAQDASAEFLLPDVGEGLTEGTIAQWLVAVGDEVALDQPLAEVETAKAVVEITSPYAGRVVELGGAEGEIIDVGSLLVAFATGDSAEAAATPGGASAAAQAPVPNTETSASQATGPESPAPADAGQGSAAPVDTAAAEPAGPRSGRTLASPATRRRARELGVDIATVTGSGPVGRVTLSDVLRVADSGPDAAAPDSAAAGRAAHSVAPAEASAAASAAASVPLATSASAPVGPGAVTGVLTGESRVEPLGVVRREIAKTMQHSWQTIPHVSEFRTVDASGLESARALLRERVSADAPKLTSLPILVRAVAVTLRHHRLLNASLNLDDATVTYHGDINIGIATSSEQGLVVPVVKGADTLSIFQISQEISRLATAVRERRIRPADLSGGTFTVSNFGSYGTRHGVPIIKPPEVGIVGFGRVHEEIVPVDGRPAVRTVQPVSMSADHRLIDGDVMGGFLNELGEYIAEPVRLLGEV